MRNVFANAKNSAQTVANQLNGEVTELKNTVEFYNQLREVVGDELIARGFNQDYEPNSYGIELEKLIDAGIIRRIIP